MKIEQMAPEPITAQPPATSGRMTAARREVYDRTRMEGPETILHELEMIGNSTFTSTGQGTLGAHSHPGHYEICLIHSGTPHWWVGDEEVTVFPGELYITRPDEMHGGQNAIMDRCALSWIIVDIATGIAGLQAAEAASITTILDQATVRTRTASTRCQEAFRNLLLAHRTRPERAELMARAHLALLLDEVAKAYSQPPSSDQVDQVEDPYAGARLSLDRYLAHHYHEPIAVSAMAQRYHLGDTRFRAVLKQQTGFTPHEYLLRFRLQRAQELLQATNRSITDIAHSCGFSSSQYFATVCKKMTGSTPKQLRSNE